MSQLLIVRLVGRAATTYCGQDSSDAREPDTAPENRGDECSADVCEEDDRRQCKAPSNESQTRLECSQLGVAYFLLLSGCLFRLAHFDDAISGTREYSLIVLEV